MKDLRTATRPGADPPPLVDALYRELLVRGVDYFFPDARLETLGGAGTSRAALSCARRDGALEFDWLGERYRLSTDRALTDGERRLLDAIGNVLAVRYQLLFDAALAARSLELFRGLPEDRYVAAFVDPSIYGVPRGDARLPDRVSDAIEVLRASALTTYENRRVETGVLLVGAGAPAPTRPAGALRYTLGLTALRSFHRLCDGLQTLALVDRDGFLVALVDVHDWAAPHENDALAVPTIDRYRPHARATLAGGHVCLVLTPNGEIKVFAGGAQVLSFLDGRWRLTDVHEKYGVWKEAVGDDRVAERLFAVALTLAEDRRGGLFLLLDDAGLAPRLIPSTDLLVDGATGMPRRPLQYLLRDRRLLDVAPAVLESVARIDGAVVLDPATNVVAFGTILRNLDDGDDGPAATLPEGGRTTAALHASRAGKVLMVSEDGAVSFFRHGRRVWQL